MPPYPIDTVEPMNDRGRELALEELVQFGYVIVDAQHFSDVKWDVDKSGLEVDVKMLTGRKTRYVLELTNDG